MDGVTTLRDLAQEAGLEPGAGPSRQINRDLLRRYCAAIPPGRWTTYGDLAAAVGMPGAGLVLGSVVANDDQITVAHRILRSTGEISPSWANAEGGPEVARKRLIDEGVEFSASGRASPTQRWMPQLPEDDPTT